MFNKKNKKMSLSDLDKNLGNNKSNREGGFFSVNDEQKQSSGLMKKIKYFFSSDNKEAAQHLVVIMGVLVLILLSCAAINKVENGMNPADRQAVAESILSDNKDSSQNQTSAAATNSSEEAQQTDGEVLNNDNDYFVNYEMEREKVRSEQLELLNEMVEGEDTLPDVKQEAENKILAITEGMENELLLESLLVAKYGGEAVVFVQEDKVNVILRPKSGKIDDLEAEKIAQLVDTYTGIGYENAIIVIKD